MMYGCIHDKDLIVMSAGLEILRRAVDVLEGSASHAGPGPVGLVVPSRGGFFYVMANAVDQMAIPHGQSAVFRETEGLGLSIGEAEGRLVVYGALGAKTEEAATAIAQMAQGMVAYMTLAGKDQPRLADLARKVRVSSKESRVSIYFESDSKEVVQFLAEQRQRDKPRPPQP